MNSVSSAAIAAGTAVIVSLISLLLGDRLQRSKDERTARQDVNARYLNPLRLHLVENHFRFSDTLKRIDQRGNRLDEQLVIDSPVQLSEKDAEWFNSEGCALVSSVYLTATLFSQLGRVREDFPYLRLSRADDTRLASLILAVQRGYLEDLGVYYVTQPSIGESMWNREQNRLLTYREFCENLQSPAWRVWLDKAIWFHLDVARGERRENAEQIIEAIKELSNFLDSRVGGGRSIQSRWEAEGITDLG